MPASGSRTAPRGSLAAPRTRLAGQARADSVGLRGDRRASSPRTSRSRSCATTKSVRAGAQDALAAHGVRRRSRPAARGARPTACGCATRRRPAWSTPRGRSCWSTGLSTAGPSTTTTPRTLGVGAAIARHHRPARARSRRATDTGGRLVLEGGGIEVNGRGLVLVTEEWLLSDTQVRNPGLGRGGLRSGCSPTGSARRRRSGSARDAWATTRTGTSTTSRGSSAPTPSCSPSSDDPADENHGRSTGQPAAARSGERPARHRPAAHRRSPVSARR